MSGVYRDGKNVSLNYTPDQAVSDRYSQTNQGIAALLPQLGQAQGAVAQRLDEAQDAYVNKATDQLSRTYTPQLRNMREDMTARFGTIQNTPYLDKMNEFENSVRGPAMADIINNSIMYRQQLDQGNQAQRLAELGGLTGVQQGDRNFALQSVNPAMDLTNVFNTFKQNNFTQDLQRYNAQLNAQQMDFQNQLTIQQLMNQMGQQRQSNTTSMLGALGGFF